MNVSIRKLIETDALISYSWRNDPTIWKFTGNRPNKVITQEMELKWIREVLKRSNEVRYAILANDVYVGNIQLTNIFKYEAQFHIFIGEKTYWGKGIASIAIKLFFKEIAFLKLKRIYLSVNKNNISALKLYIKAGFNQFSTKDDFIIMEKMI